MENTEIREKINNRLMELLNRCADRQSCEEDDVFSIEALEPYSEKWIEKIYELANKVDDAYRIIMKLFIILSENIDNLSFSEDFEKHSFYYYEVDGTMFDAHRMWSGEIINCQNSFCGYVDLVQRKDLIKWIDDNQGNINFLMAYSIINIDIEKIEIGGMDIPMQ